MRTKLLSQMSLVAFGLVALLMAQTVMGGDDPPTCPWDCQEKPDGVVGVPDLLELLEHWGDDDEGCDFDGGGVGVSDLLILLANWGPCPP